MKRLRRFLLEIWAVVPLAAIAGFIGPFGTYLHGDFVWRFGRWWVLLMGAYILVRPSIVFWSWLARATRLPPRLFVFFGIIASSFPMALIWQNANFKEVSALVGFPAILPFALLCALLVLTVTGWAERADATLLKYYGDGSWDPEPGAPPPNFPDAAAPPPQVPGGKGRLYERLSAAFEGRVLALESEDHYVRVHGAKRSELLLLRLRDAIAEMDGAPGEQTHRSWWVARDAVASVTGAGRSRAIVLINGVRVPIARDSVDRLQRSGFLGSP